MFTGIVQAIGSVVRAGPRLEVAGELPYVIPKGGSVAVNGCCLTHVGGDHLCFDLSDETLSRTTLGKLVPGNKVNLEAALRSGDPMGGHHVQGHVDEVAVFIGRRGEDFRFAVKQESAVYLVDKGSITIDGISLTVVEPLGGEFHVAVIPHTLQVTTLGQLVPGNEVNVEYDVVAKYLSKK